MDDEEITVILKKHWEASSVGNADAEHEIYDDNVVCEYPQSGERIFGKTKLQAIRTHHPQKPSGFYVKRISGKENLWITEYVINYLGQKAHTVSIMEFSNGKVVYETQYFAEPFQAPDWRSQCVS